MKGFTWAAVLTALLVFGVVAHHRQQHHAESKTSHHSWKITITTPDEPGEPLLVSGTVYKADGKTPLPGATVTVYHTDRTGLYAPKDAPHGTTRLRGVMTTNQQGAYEFRTIKPASYPNSRNPSHIHYILDAPGFPQQFTELIFEGDPFVTPEFLNEMKREGNSAEAKRLVKDSSGVLKCRFDIVLKPST